MKQRVASPRHTAEQFGLDVMGSEDDLFRWFLMAYMLGKPIQSQVAVNTWRLFVDKGFDTPWALVNAHESTLSHLLVKGNYTRYNHVMARALHKMSRQLITMYEGSLLLMMNASRDETEFAMRLKELYGIGPKTAEIVMRETQEFFARRVE